MEEAADKPIYKWTHHIVSGHTLKHLCAAMVPVFLTLMLAKRSIETERYSSHFFFSFMQWMSLFEGCYVLHFTFFHLLSFSLFHSASNLWLVTSNADEIGKQSNFSLNTNFCFYWGIYDFRQCLPLYVLPPVEFFLLMSHFPNHSYDRTAWKLNSARCYNDSGICCWTLELDCPYYQLLCWEIFRDSHYLQLKYQFVDGVEVIFSM